MSTLAAEMHGLNRVALSNLWLFEPVVRRQLIQIPSANALTDERISVANYAEIIRFYETLISHAAGRRE